MASKASSIQPRAAANSVRRWATVMFGSTPRTEDMGRDCHCPVGNWQLKIKPGRTARSAGQMKVAARLLHIPCNLLAQCLHRGEFDFLPDTLEEEDLDFCSGFKIDRVEIEQVGLDGEGIRSEGWAVSDVCDRIEAFPTDACTRDVDAVLRNQFVVAA